MMPPTPPIPPFTTYYLVYNPTMFRINIHDMKTNLSKHLDDLAPGESLLICRRNVAIAEVRRLAAAGDGPRPCGLAKGQFHVPDAFFEPLPDDIVGDFEGRSL